VAHGGWRLNLALIAGLAVCLFGFVVELRRGLAGNFLAWVYVFEWPLFAAGGTYLWWRLRNDDLTTEPDLDPASSVDPDDADLRAWRAYIDRLESDDGSAGGRPSS